MSAYERDTEELRKSRIPNIKIQDKSIVMLDGSGSYFPYPTLARFHNDDSKIRLIRGPYGSGKSSAMCAEIVLRACAMPPCYDGIRRAKTAIIRNTYPELKTTSIKTWQEWFGHIGLISENNSPPMIYVHRFNDGMGIIELEIVFLALEGEQDVRKLKSLDLTNAWINEAKELPIAVLDHLGWRVGRYPAAKMCKHEYWSGVFMDTNPPPTDHWIYRLFEEQKLSGHSIYAQPPGVIKVDDGYVANPEAENVQVVANDGKGLKSDYYTSAIIGKNEEFIKVYAMGEYGIVIEGKPVYPQYNDDLHSVATIPFDDGQPLLLNFDFGLTPACLLMQDIKGQKRCIKEFVTERMGIRELVESIIIPFVKKNFPNSAIYATCDPSGSRGMDTDTVSCIMVVREFGIDVEPSITNGITTRIEAANFLLNRLVEGKPAVIISREGCPALRKGFLGEYCYKRVRTIGQESYRDVPDKSHPISDIHDCFQYGSLWYNGVIDKDKQLAEVKRILGNKPTSAWV